MAMHVFDTDHSYLDYLHSVLAESSPVHINKADANNTHNYSVNINLRHAVNTAVWFNNTAMSELPKGSQSHAVKLQWCGSDTESAYAAHCDDPDSKYLLQRWGWLNTPVAYELNREGWRSDGCAEFDIDEPSMIAIGCSFTFGTGLNHNQTWCAKTAAALGLRLVNLGAPGQALDLSTLWLLLNQHRITNPRVVMLCEPPAGRIGWLAHSPLDNNTYGHTLLRMARGDGDHNLSSSAWLINNLKLNAVTNYYRNANLVKLWAHSKNIPFLHFNNLNLDPRTQSLARDLQHFGEKWHTELAKNILGWTNAHVKNL